MEAREAEFDVTDVGERSMRRDEAPFVFPVTNDPELARCDDLLRAQRRGYALVRYQPLYLTTPIRMRTPFLEKQNDKKREEHERHRTSAAQRSELKNRQKRAENKKNEGAIHEALNLEPLWREQHNDDTVEMHADDESKLTEQPQVERRQTHCSAGINRLKIVQIEGLTLVNSAQILTPHSNATSGHSTCNTRKRSHAPDESQFQDGKDIPAVKSNQALEKLTPTTNAQTSCPTVTIGRFSKRIFLR